MISRNGTTQPFRRASGEAAIDGRCPGRNVDKLGKSRGPTQRVATLLDVLATSAHSSPTRIASGSHHIAIAGTFFLGRLGLKPVATLIG